MAKAKKEKLYWSAVILYGVLLVGVLLYIRFPAEKFRIVCRQFIEERIPGVTCSIGRIQLGFPLALRIEEIRLNDAKEVDMVLYEDSLFTLKPIWSSLGEEFAVTSRAFAGNHTARINIGREDGNFELKDVELTGINLEKLPFLRQRLNRKITGIMSADGSALINREKLQLITAQAGISIIDGGVELKRPILELNTLELKEGVVDISVKDNKVEISEGKIDGSKIKMEFTGEITIAARWHGGEVALQGSITPLAPLFQQNRQLKVIVTRMQKRQGDVALPFKVAGTLGMPTFVFAR